MSIVILRAMCSNELCLYVQMTDKAEYQQEEKLCLKQ